MPYEIRMNMFLIDCSELNGKLSDICDSLINDILEKAADIVFQEKATNITSEVKKIQEEFNARAENSKKLVE